MLTVLITHRADEDCEILFLFPILAQMKLVLFFFIKNASLSLNDTDYMQEVLLLQLTLI